MSGREVSGSSLRWKRVSLGVGEVDVDPEVRREGRKEQTLGGFRVET